MRLTGYSMAANVLLRENSKQGSIIYSSLFLGTYVSFITYFLYQTNSYSNIKYTQVLHVRTSKSPCIICIDSNSGINASISNILKELPEKYKNQFSTLFKQRCCIYSLICL